MHTSSSCSDEDTNNLNFQFTSAVLPNDDLRDGDEHVVICSVLYGTGNYVWTGSNTLGKLSLKIKRKYEMYGELIKSPSSLKKGESTAIKLNLHLSAGIGSSFKLTMFNLFGTDDQFNIGKPKLKWGSNFASQESRFDTIRQDKSLSGLQYQRVTYLVPAIINDALDGSLEDPGNLVSVMIPLTALHTGSGLNDLTVAVIIGDNDNVWSKTFEVDKSPQTFIAERLPTIVTATLLNPEATYPGSSAVFQIISKVNIGSHAQTKVTVYEDCQNKTRPLNVQLLDAGSCGIVPLENIIEGGDLVVDFGLCSNVGDADTNVILTVALFTSATAAVGETIGTKARIGTSLQLDLTYEVIERPVSHDQIVAVKTSLGFTNQPVRTDTEIGTSIKVKIPLGFKPSNLTLEIIPSLNQTRIEADLCLVEIVKIGKGLPCIHSNAKSNIPVYSKINKGTYLNDSVSINLGKTCPAGLLSSGNENTFTIRFFYRIPNPHSDLKPITSIFQDDRNVFTSQITRNMRESEFSNVQVSNVDVFSERVPYIGIQESAEKFVNSGGIYHTKFVIKTNPKTRGKYLFEHSELQKVTVCRIMVTRIGKNMPCLNKPEGILKGHKVRLTDRGIDFGVVTNWGSDLVSKDLLRDDNSIEVAMFYRTVFTRGPQTLYGSINGIKSSVTTLKLGLPGIDFNHHGNLNPTFVSVLENDSLGIGYRTVPKVFSLRLSVVRNYGQTINIKFTNPDFKTKLYHFCDVRINKRGLNIPCNLKEKVKVNL